ncbi:MAG: PAS domain S-box protein [Acidobacteria bacterium]|nr:PAS domain S-box protein [Acidobacteriota bacterium]
MNPILDAERDWSTRARDDREGAPREILIVDDEEDVRWLLATMLREYGFESVEARDGQEALEQLEVRSPAAILMDMRMPVLDGISALKKIRADHPDVPIVMITAYGDIGSAVEAMKIGASDYVTKPFSNAHIVRAVFGALERRAAEKAWRESYVLLRAIVEGTDDLVFVKDLQGRYLMINAAGARLLGRSVEEIVGKGASDLFSPGRAREIMERERSMIATGGTVTYEETVEIAGAVRTCLSTTGVYRDHHGGIVGLIGISRDITERKHVEKALRDSEARFRSLAETASDAIISADRSGTIVFWNGAAESMFGYGEQEAVGERLHFLMREQYRAMCQAELEHVRPAAQSHLAGRTVELHGLRKDGTEFPIEISLAAWKKSDETFYTAIIRDTTARKGFEEQLRQSQKMEAVGQLAGGIAHDFNNLLTAILGYSELLLEKLGETHPLFEDVAEIRKAGERGAALTQQILAFGRKQTVLPRVLDLNTVVTRGEKLLRRVIGEDIAIRMRLGHGLGRVKADPVQIEEIVLNLAVNARDAMPQGGTLTIATASVVLDSEFVRRHFGSEPGRHVSITVQDTGCGMTPNVLTHIFEPFFTTKGPDKGTGLGLSTVYGIVKQSDGYITVESTPGIGTTVTTYWPAVDDPIESAGAVPRSVNGLKGTETILLVEDETGVRDLIQRVLEGCGYTVLQARDAGDAIAIEETHRGPIHLLLSDIIMPGLNGPDLAQRIVRRRPAIKVLYASGFANRIDLGSLSRSASFIQKPFTPEILATNVRECLDRHVGQTGRESASL